MIPEAIFEMIGEAAFGRLNRSRKAQVLFRVFFGLLGTALGLFGVYHFLVNVEPPASRLLHASIVALFAFVAARAFFHIACKRPWRWPVVGVAVSFAALFITRIAFGP